MIVRSAALLFRSAPVLLGAGLALLPAVAHAQKNEFILVIDGKTMGKNVFTIKPAKSGYTLESRYTIKIPSSDTSPVGLLDLTDDFKLGSDYTYLEGTVTDQTNYAHHVTYTKNKAGDELTIANYSGAKPITDIVPIKPTFLMLTPMDAGSAQALLLGIVGHPAPDDMYNVFVSDPTGGGGGGGGGGRRGKGGGGGASSDPAANAGGGSDAANTLYAFKWFKGKDSGGTLDGKPVLLHTYMLAQGRSRYIFYADDNNSVMQINSPAQKASYIRSKFQLNAPKPAEAAAPAKP